MNQPPDTPRKTLPLYPWRRLFAFWLDTALVAVPVRFLIFVYSPELYLRFYTALYGLAPAMLVVLTSLPLAAFTTSRWGTTAGKYLLGLRVAYIDITPSVAHPINERGFLRFTPAYRRAISAFVIGAAMQIGQIMPFALFFSYRSVKYRRYTLWDLVCRTRVMGKPVTTGGVTLYAMISAVLLALNAWPMMETVYKELLAVYLEQLAG